MSLEIFVEDEENENERIRGKMVQQQTLSTSQREPPPGPISYEEFLEWADEDTLAEWVDGEVIMVSPASDRHQDIADFLTSILRIYVSANDLGWVRSAPFQMKTGAGLPGREPDILLLCKEHLDRIKDTYLDGPADLAVEIVSPETGPRDRGEKFYEYESGRLAEYWLIDVERQQAEFYRLGEDNRYHTAFPDEDGRYYAQEVSGLWIQVSWLWQTPLPSPIRTVGEIAGIDAELIAAFEKALRHS